MSPWISVTHTFWIHMREHWGDSTGLEVLFWKTIILSSFPISYSHGQKTLGWARTFPRRQSGRKPLSNLFDKGSWAHSRQQMQRGGKLVPCCNPSCWHFYITMQRDYNNISAKVKCGYSKFGVQWLQSAVTERSSRKWRLLLDAAAPLHHWLGQSVNWKLSFLSSYRQ